MALRAATVALNDPPETVNDNPVQTPEVLVPVITLQYDPAAREVANDAVQAASALLITTNPAVPRPNAICELCGATQFVIAALPTLFLKATIPETAGRRCWQSHPPEPPAAAHAPAPLAGAPSSVEEYV